MNTYEYVATELAKNTSIESEAEAICLIPGILKAAGHSKNMVSFIVNDPDFLGETLDHYYSLV